MSIEGGNYYEDQILREQTQGETDRGPDVYDMGVEASEIQSETTLSVEELRRNTELNQQLQPMLDGFRGLAESQGFEYFDVFQTFMLEQISLDLKQAFLSDPIQAQQLFATVQQSGRFPVNDFEFQQSIITGGTALGDIAEVEAETAEVQAETAEVQAETTERIRETEENRIKFLDFKESISGLDVSNQDLLSLLQQLEAQGEVTIENAGVFEEICNNIVATLQSSRTIEEEILPQAQAQGPEVFTRVTQTLVSIDPSFQARIDAWELVEPIVITELPPEQQIRTSAALGTDVEGVVEDAEQTGNIFTIETETGEAITYDVVTNERALSLDGYSIPSQVEDTGDYQTPKLEYMRVEQETLPRLQKIAAAAEAIGEAMFDSEELASIKETLRENLGFTYYTELGLENMQTAAELKAAIQSAYRENNTQLEEARETYRQALDGLRDAHMGALERRDRKVRETLRFLESIGFTDIPQYITDQIIDTLNSNSGLRRQVGFTEEIDFSNGQLGTDYSQDGESLDGSIPLADRQRFAEIINRMIGVVDENGNPPINVAAIGTTSVPVGDRTQFMGLLNESGLMNVGGIGIAMDNLQTRVEQQ